MDQFTAIRQDFELPGRDEEGGKPYSPTLPPYLQEQLGPRKCEILDIVYLREMKKWGNIREHLVVDLSQAVKRKPVYGDGRIVTPMSSSEYFHIPMKRNLSAAEIFQCLGWNKKDLILDGAFTHQGCWRLITGNMMAIPNVGSIEFVLIKAFLDLNVGNWY
eukprot:3024896-Pyramimonas_sp.AAC.2